MNALVLAALLLAQPPAPQIAVPRELAAEVGDFVTVKATTNGKAVKWHVEGKGLATFPQEMLRDTTALVVVGKAPGTYRVLAWTALGDLPSELAVCTVKVTGPAPDPGPGPSPPGPVVPGKRYVVVVEDTAQAAAGRGALFADPALAARFEAKGHHWRIVDKGVVDASGKPPADVVPYLQRAQGKALPQLFLVDERGQILAEGPCPGTAGELLALLQKVGG